MSRLSPLSPFFVLFGLCRPYRAHMLRTLFQGFTPLAISFRPFGAQETVLLLRWQVFRNVGGTLKEWQGSPECGRHLRCRIRKERANLGPQIPLSAFTKNFPVR